MLIKVAPTLSGAHQDLVRELVGVGFADVDHDDVEVHVRSRPPRVRWVVRYQVPLDRLTSEARRRWLAVHPGTTSAAATRAYRRRLDATAAAAALGGTVCRYVDDRLGERMSAFAYYALPAVARVAAGAAYLVTMRLPRHPEALSYPFELQYRRRGVPMPTAPVVQVRSWLEELVHLAAHEARHVDQYRLGLPKSEVDAERWAGGAVERFRELPPYFRCGGGRA